ncbi:uncharacterized protein (DUF2235 family) [Janthinobacterium sp. CG_23.3]|uniref:DUF2235 domain-containing protein n=1 Tax=Janthinobacterium sp. CG_23.3 TaxID=3349634 RepID=UPI0038D39BD2
MGKNIILLSDGTGNSSGKAFRTNVWRIYQAADLADPQHPSLPRQFALYDDGVGSSSFRPWALLCGSVGIGLARNVRELYIFLCRIYEPGDRIYGFGFSRGAFTIRVLTGLVMSQGLVPYGGNEGRLQRLAAGAYRAYRRQYTTRFGLLRPLRAVRDVVIDVLDRLASRPRYRDVAKRGGPGSENPLQIEFLGLWDTVDAYGLPMDEVARVIDRFIWPFRMPDLNLNPRVKRAMHALSIDDERRAFHPRLWNEEELPGRSAPEAATHVDAERISQVWFAGVHSNVGGGYPDDSLSYVSLEWIMAGAAKCGLRFSDKIWQGFRALGDENGRLYDSRRGLASYYRYKPRRIENLVNNDEVRIRRPKIHESVLRRISVGHEGYAPFVLPPDFAVARVDGSIVDGGAYLHLKDIGKQSAFGNHSEHVYNWVWWRSAANLFTIAVTLALVLMPLLLRGKPAAACGGIWCLLAAGIDFLASMLPGVAQRWIGWFSSHPKVLLTLAVMAVGGLAMGKKLECRISDAMRPVWYHIAKMRTLSGPACPPTEPGRINRTLEWLRTRRTYHAVAGIVQCQIVPVLFIAAIGFGGIGLLLNATYGYR